MRTRRRAVRDVTSSSNRKAGPRNAGSICLGAIGSNPSPRNEKRPGLPGASKPGGGSRIRGLASRPRTPPSQARSGEFLRTPRRGVLLTRVPALGERAAPARAPRWGIDSPLGYRSSVRILLSEMKSARGLRARVYLAEEVGFEPTEPCGSTVFKTAAFNHSAIPPLRFPLYQQRPRARRRFAFSKSFRAAHAPLSRRLLRFPHVACDQLEDFALRGWSLLYRDERENLDSCEGANDDSREEGSGLG